MPPTTRCMPRQQQSQGFFFANWNCELNLHRPSASPPGTHCLINHGHVASAPPIGTPNSTSTDPLTLLCLINSGNVPLLRQSEHPAPLAVTLNPAFSNTLPCQQRLCGLCPTHQNSKLDVHGPLAPPPANSLDHNGDVAM